MTAPLLVGDTVYIEVYDSCKGQFVVAPATVRGRQRETDPTRPMWVAVELVHSVGDGNEYAAGDVVVRPPSALRSGERGPGAASYVDAHLRDLPPVRVDRYRVVEDGA